MGGEGRIEPSTPEPITQIEPNTPQTIRILRSSNRAVGRGELDPRRALLKAEKRIEPLLTENVLLQRENASMREAQRLDRVTRGSRETLRFPSGHLFDPVYEAHHIEELAARKEQEMEARQKKRQNSRKAKQPAQPNFVQLQFAGPSSPVCTLKALGCMHQKLHASKV